ncbi:methyltransferase domain-containing protein [Candidatus Pacearchaeota archaeon]|nr:methyltransferase domain-containing protein [Candidatus Pacearchaeota archaeon]MBI2056853.1 methyltransferase domain-containing protein [Candidatus Pacearchaeota archaeon]
MNLPQMLQSVRNYLSQFGKPDEKILKAIEKTDRKNFMEKNKSFAYLDQAIPIGHGQTISQPSTVARMLSLLELKKTDEVLEIGTGSSWNAALLGYLSKKVLTLEIVPELAKNSQEKIKKLEIKNVEVKQGDFRELKQKFNKIIFTAGISREQETIIENFTKKHLKENGILVCPYREGPLIILEKKKRKIKKTFTEENYVFVPLILE